MSSIIFIIGKHTPASRWFGNLSGVVGGRSGVPVSMLLKAKNRNGGIYTPQNYLDTRMSFMQH
jgi:hypothetical protein